MEYSYSFLIKLTFSFVPVVKRYVTRLVIIGDSVTLEVISSSHQMNSRNHTRLEWVKTEGQIYRFYIFIRTGRESSTL